MIYVTGDIHGDPRRFSKDIFGEQSEMTKDDYVIICGDFGLVWDYRGENKTEKYWLDWLEDKSFTTLFVDGNHENFDRLENYQADEWHGGKVHFVRPSVIHLMRGQVFEIQGKKFFTFGGASSHDITSGILDPEDKHFTEKRKALDKDRSSLYRINHWSWWKQELPTEDEMQEGLDNLKKSDNKVDYIITHCAYNSLLPQLDGGSGLYTKDMLTDYLQQIKQTVDYKHWLFGHYHINKTFYWESASCLYEQIIRIV